MNMKAAFQETIEIAERQQMPEWGGSLSLGHLREMNDQVQAGDFSEGKLGRWLGWAQAAVVAAGCASLEDMKALNKRHI